LSFTYDGFGNLKSEIPTKGTAPNATFSYDVATNRLVGPYQYDANGNLTGMPALSFSYDAGNRITQTAHTINGTEQYECDPFNRRTAKTRADGTQDVYNYGTSGEQLGVYFRQWSLVRAVRENVYFAGELIWSGLTQGAPGMLTDYPLEYAVTTDRLGSVVAARGAAERASFYPYGEERTPYTSQDRTKFGTYYRDGVSNLDYANQRYYSSQVARFLTPDPYRSETANEVPQAWNRYAYVENDPANYVDPTGLLAEFRECLASPFGLPGGWIDTSTNCPVVGGSGPTGVGLGGWFILLPRTRPPYHPPRRPPTARPRAPTVENAAALSNAFASIANALPWCTSPTAVCIAINAIKITVGIASAGWLIYQAKSRAGEAADQRWAIDEATKICGRAPNPEERERAHRAKRGDPKGARSREDLLNDLLDAMGCSGAGGGH
jgi:RHS repeat-associated protein